MISSSPMFVPFGTVPEPSLAASALASVIACFPAAVPGWALIPSGSLDSDACVPPEPISFSPPLPVGTKLELEADPDEADVVDPLDADVAEPLDPDPPAAELELDFELELPQAASTTAAITTANADKLCT